MLDSFGLEGKNNECGGIYTIAGARTLASRKTGEWQEVEAKMVGNKVTVYMNGVKIHDTVTVDRKVIVPLIIDGQAGDDNLTQLTATIQGIANAGQETLAATAADRFVALTRAAIEARHRIRHG